MIDAPLGDGPTPVLQPDVGLALPDLPARHGPAWRQLRQIAVHLLLVVLLVTVGVVLYALLVVAPGVAAISRTAPARVQAILVQHHSTFLSYDALGRWLPRAIVSVEDHRFFQHGPMDPLATSRALLFDLRGGRPLQGGATIDVQLAKRLLGVPTVDPFTHALQELVLAWQLDSLYGKRGVLTLYLNDIFYGRGAYGAAAAARIFFHSTPARLSLAQGAFLAGLPNAPSIFGDQPTSAVTRVRWMRVLDAMERVQTISKAQARRALSTREPPGLQVP